MTEVASRRVSGSTLSIHSLQPPVTALMAARRCRDAIPAVRRPGLTIVVQIGVKHRAPKPVVVDTARVWGSTVT